jgi:hypothetical protein
MLVIFFVFHFVLDERGQQRILGFTGGSSQLLDMLQPGKATRLTSRSRDTLWRPGSGARY